MKICREVHFEVTEEIDMSNIAKARRTAQRHTKPTDTPRPTTGHATALQTDEIQLHQPEHRHKLPQPGKHHRTPSQPHPQGQTPQPRTMTLRTFSSSSSYKSHCLLPLHISTFTLALCGAIQFSFLFFLGKKKKFILRFFFICFTLFGDDFSNFFWAYSTAFLIVLD